MVLLTVLFSSQTGGKWSAAPEPTSEVGPAAYFGVAPQSLLLLGVAGLALKRKRFAQSKSEVEVEQWNGKIPL